MCNSRLSVNYSKVFSVQRSVFPAAVGLRTVFLYRINIIPSINNRQSTINNPRVNDHVILQEFRYKDETTNFVPMEILSHFRHEFSVKEASVYLAWICSRVILSSVVISRTGFDGAYNFHQKDKRYLVEGDIFSSLFLWV